MDALSLIVKSYTKSFRETCVNIITQYQKKSDLLPFKQKCLGTFSLMSGLMKLSYDKQNKNTMRDTHIAMNLSHKTVQ